MTTSDHSVMELNQPRPKVLDEMSTTRHRLNSLDARKAKTVNAGLMILDGLSHTDLVPEWRKAFGAGPPKNLSKRLMVHALAYQIQVKAYGSLTRAARKALENKADPQPDKSLRHASSSTLQVRDKADTGRREARGADERLPPPALKLSAGTRLMREWRGTLHVVDVTPEGFVWNGRTCRSLSAIARTITGTRWNGLAFFGLRKRKGITPHISGKNIDGATPKLPNECPPNELPALEVLS